MELLIVGANAAGLAAALEARRRDPDCRITVLDRASDVSWSTCDLPYSLTPGRSPEDLVLRRPADFLPKGIRILVEHAVESVDLQHSSLAGSGPLGRRFELGWDRLILCSGVRTRALRDSRGEPADLPGARTLEDARILAARLPRVSSVLVIGAGPVGLELADCLHGPERPVTLLEAGPRPLAGWPVFAGEAMARALERSGVNLVVGSPVAAVDRTGQGYRVRLANGTELTASLVINASGVMPARDFLPAGLLEEDEQGFLIVDEGMATRDGRVFAAGDLVLRRSCVDGRLFRSGLALDARRGGRVAGANAVAPSGRPVLQLPTGPGSLALVACGLELARTGHPCLLEGESAGPLAAVFPSDPASAPETDTAPRPASAGPGLLGHQPPPDRAGASADPVIRGNQRALVRQSYPLSGHRGELCHLHLQLEAGLDGRLGAATLVAEGPGALRIDVLSALLSLGAGWRELEALDLAYTPPLGPAVDPLIQAARSLGDVIRAANRNRENQA